MTFRASVRELKNILVNKVNKTVWSTCRWRRRIQPQPASVFTFFHLKNVPGGLYWWLSPCIFSAFEGLVLSGLPHSSASSPLWSKIKKYIQKLYCLRHFIKGDQKQNYQLTKPGLFVIWKRKSSDCLFSFQITNQSNQWTPVLVIWFLVTLDKMKRHKNCFVLYGPLD